MARDFCAKSLAVLLACSLLCTGCVELPLVGNLGEKLKGILPPSISERLFGPPEGGPASTPIGPRHVARRTSLSAGMATTGAAATTKVRDEESSYERFLARNTEFDHLRTQGLRQLYAGQTAEAIASFKEALKKKPGDKNATELLEMAEHPPIDSTEPHPPGVPTGVLPAGAVGLPAGTPAGIVGRNSQFPLVDNLAHQAISSGLSVPNLPSRTLLPPRQ